MSSLTAPKVSVIMPSLNVAPYIRQCIESVVRQTLRDIEIICVDAGSTDGTFEILREYAEKDSRITLLRSDKKSYGYQMNMGIDAARGEYIGIVETDDIIRPNMYKELYRIASRNSLDLIKADFYRFTCSNGRMRREYVKIAAAYPQSYNHVLTPRDDTNVFRVAMNTWSGIYRADFLRENGIRHNETPGASYQDNGFWFQTFALAERAYFADHAYYMVRRDNPNSSVHSKSKVYCMNEEYVFIRDFLRVHADIEARLLPTYCRAKFSNYQFTLGRIGSEFKKEYVLRISAELKQDRKDGILDKALYNEWTWAKLNMLIDDPLMFYFDQCAPANMEKDIYYYRSRCMKLEREIAGLKNSRTYKATRAIRGLSRKLRRGMQCCREHGVRYTARLMLKKLGLAGR